MRSRSDGTLVLPVLSIAKRSESAIRNMRNDFLAIQKTRNLICCYQNQTNYPQIIRVRNAAERCLERTVLPNQMIRFEASKSSILEINSCTTVTSTVCDHIPCKQLTCAVPLPVHKQVIAHLTQAAA